MGRVSDFVINTLTPVLLLVLLLVFLLSAVMASVLPPEHLLRVIYTTVLNLSLFAFSKLLPILLFVTFIFVVILPILVLVDILTSQFNGNDKLAWLLFIIFIPVIGPILYLSTGRKQKVGKS